MQIVKPGVATTRKTRTPTNQTKSRKTKKINANHIAGCSNKTKNAKIEKPNRINKKVYLRVGGGLAAANSYNRSLFLFGEFWLFYITVMLIISNSTVHVIFTLLMQSKHGL